MPRTKAVAVKSTEKPSKKNLHTQKVARKDTPSTTGVKKRRFKPGAKALREIKNYQRSTDLLVSRAGFQRKGNYHSTQFVESLVTSPLPKTLMNGDESTGSKHPPSSPFKKPPKQP
jgi:hypothetical protein